MRHSINESSTSLLATWDRATTGVGWCRFGVEAGVRFGERTGALTGPPPTNQPFQNALSAAPRPTLGSPKLPLRRIIPSKERVWRLRHDTSTKYVSEHKRSTEQNANSEVGSGLQTEKSGNTESPRQQDHERKYARKQQQRRPSSVVPNVSLANGAVVSRPFASKDGNTHRGEVAVRDLGRATRWAQVTWLKWNQHISCCA